MIDHMLCRAIQLRAPADGEPVPDRFASTKDAVARMERLLRIEASEEMREAIDAPETPYLHPVDLDTDDPGIVYSKTRSKLMVHRRSSAPGPGVPAECPTDVEPPRDVPRERAAKKCEKEYRRDIAREEKRAARAVRRTSC